MSDDSSIAQSVHDAPACTHCAWCDAAVPVGLTCACEVARSNANLALKAALVAWAISLTTLFISDRVGYLFVVIWPWAILASVIATVIVAIPYAIQACTLRWASFVTVRAGIALVLSIGYVAAIVVLLASHL